MTEVEKFYHIQKEPEKGLYLALRDTILAQDPEIANVWRYGMPFFYFRRRMYCYLWFHKKYKLPYIGFMDGIQIDHPSLIQEGRARVKILLLRPDEDLPINILTVIL